MKSKKDSGAIKETLLELFNLCIKDADIRGVLKKKEKAFCKLFIYLVLSMCLVLWSIRYGPVAIILLMAVLGCIGLYFLRKSEKATESTSDKYWLELWDEVSSLFDKVHSHKFVPDSLDPPELIKYIEREVRETVREILRLQRFNTSPMRDTAAPHKVYLRNLMALVVRLGLMNTDQIQVGMCEAESELYDHRADWFYGKLFENPDFVIPDESES